MFRSHVHDVHGLVIEHGVDFWSGLGPAIEHNDNYAVTARNTCVVCAICCQHKLVRMLTPMSRPLQTRRPRQWAARGAAATPGPAASLQGARSAQQESSRCWPLAGASQMLLRKLHVWW